MILRAPCRLFARRQRHAFDGMIEKSVYGCGKLGYLLGLEELRDNDKSLSVEFVLLDLGHGNISTIDMAD